MIKIGVIGYGYWGTNLVRNFSGNDRLAVTMVGDLNSARLELVKKRYPSAEVTTDYREVIASLKTDAIAIATPVASHFELALAALRAGKHVFLEKPLTATVDQAVQLNEEASSRNLVLLVDHTFIYTPAVRKIKDLVSSGEVGDIYYYDSVRINLGLFQHDVNVLWDLAVHDLAIMDYVVPAKALAVSATGLSHFSGQPENTAYLTIFLENSVIAHIHANWLAPVKIRMMLIGGSRKMIVYDDLEVSEKVKVYDKGVNCVNDDESVRKMIIGYRTGDMLAPQLELSEALAVEAEHFARCIEDGEKPLTDGLAGLRVVKILEAANQSMLNQGRPVELNP